MTARHFENLARQISHFYDNYNYNYNFKYNYFFFFGAITITI